MNGLRARILAGEVIMGTFLKTPSMHVAELLGRGGLDFAVADMEHGPIGTGALDGLALAARSVGMPLLIRSTSAEAVSIWPALDLGCSGVMVPHINDAAAAQAVASAVKYGRGSRGFSPSGRAGEYGMVDPVEYRERMDAETVIVAQIEDGTALANLDAIAEVPEVDLLFVGPVDLSMSLKCAVDAPEVAAAIDAVIAAAARAGKASGVFVTDTTKIAPLAAKGVSFFVCGSDQSLILKGTRHIMSTAASL